MPIFLLLLAGSLWLGDLQSSLPGLKNYDQAALWGSISGRSGASDATLRGVFFSSLTSFGGGGQFLSNKVTRTTSTPTTSTWWEEGKSTSTAKMADDSIGGGIIKFADQFYWAALHPGETYTASTTTLTATESHSLVYRKERQDWRQGKENGADLCSGTAYWANIYTEDMYANSWNSLSPTTPNVVSAYTRDENGTKYQNILYTN